MVMFPGVKMYLKQSITRYPKTGYGNSGQPTFGSATTIKCLIQSKKMNTMDKDGNDIVSSTQIIVDGDTTIDSLDKIILPDGIDVYIIKVETITDFSGTAHYKMIYT
jgi:hypothetical protein